jgi:hypothetical protein
MNTTGKKVRVDSDAIFMVTEGTLKPILSTPYESEGLLQKLIADFPDLVAGGQIDPEDPRRWVLVGREIGVPDHDGGFDRWSVDNLLLDQDAVPTIVEVKRSSDTRIRREVVGQMLDYAANGIRYWPIDDIRGYYEESHKHPQEEIAKLTDNNYTYEDFWRRVEGNLRSRRVRMVWVADKIPTELLSIIEYLNDELKNAEAVAVEIQQYVGPDVQLLVPRVLGLSAEQRLSRSRTGSFEEHLARSNDATKELAELLWHLGESEDYEASTTRTGLKVKFAGHRFAAMLLYPQWNSIEFSVGALTDVRLEDAAEGIRSRLSSYDGTPVSERQPHISTDSALAAWQDIVDDLLPLYRDAHEQAKAIRATERSD